MRTRTKNPAPVQEPVGRPEPAVFTRDNPCTKLDLWNCFRGKRGFVQKQIDVAYSIIGKNAPRYLIREGYAERVEIRGTEYLRLTEMGATWLEKKFLHLLSKHPEWKENACNLPRAAL
jgi:hypothetical protein